MEKAIKTALVVGCNYPGTQYELHGCHNDALAMRETLVSRFGFDPKHINLLLDNPGSPVIPTGANIKNALNKMVNEAKPGDVLFMHFSGHGTMVNNRSYSSKREEAIVPSDFNLITSVDFRELVNHVPKGATFTILSDSCHSGGLIDKEKEQVGPRSKPNNTIVNPPITSYKTKEIPFHSILNHLGSHLLEVFGQDASLMFRNKPEQVMKPLKEDEGILLSGCQTNESSADVASEGCGKKPCGAFSNAIQVALKENPGALSNREIVVLARKVLSSQSFIIQQHPCLYCSDENADKVFLGSPVQKTLSELIK